MKKISGITASLLVLHLVFAILCLPAYASETNGIKVYDSTYDYIYSLNGEYYTVYNDRNYAIVDSANTQHYTTNGDGMGAFSEGFVSLYDSEAHKVTFTTLDGYSFDVESVRGCGKFLGGKCSVTSVGGAYGLIDTTGHYLLECEYEDIIYDSSEVFFVCKDNVWQLATLKNGAVDLDTFVTSNVTNPVKDSTMQNIIASDGEHYGVISAENKLLVEFKYEYIYDLKGGLYAGMNGKTTDLISVDGKVVATMEATVLGSCSEGKIPCYMNEKFCYINREGKVVNEVAVSDTTSIGSYHEGLAVIQMKDGSYSYLAENGEFATRYAWDYAARFARGYALVMDVVASGTVDGEYVRSWKIIDHNFNTVEQLNVEVYVNDAEEHTTDFSNGFIRTVDSETGKMGFAYTANTHASYDCQSDGHVNGNWIIDKEAEIGTAGEKHISCIKCGEVRETASIDPLPEGDEIEPNPDPDPDDTTSSENPGTDPNNPDNNSDLADYIDSIAARLGITSSQLLMIAGGSLAALILLIIIITAIRRRRY